MGAEGYRKLRMVLTHSRLDRHVHQTRHTAISKHSRLAHRQAKCKQPLGSHASYTGRHNRQGRK